MAEEKNLSQIDVKDIFSKVNFRSILSNKSYIYVAASFILFFYIVLFDIWTLRKSGCI